MPVDVRLTGMPGSDVNQLTISLNALLTDLATLNTQMASNAVALASAQAAIAKTRYLALGNPGLAIDANFDVKNANAISYTNGGTLKTLAANVNFDTGTTATIAANTWSAALLTVNAAGAGVVTWGGTGLGDETAAIATMPTPAATETVVGFITVRAAGALWTAGAHALAGGVGGTPAATTNYYNSIDPANTVYGDVTTGAALYDTINTAPITVSAEALTVGGTVYAG